MNLVCYQNKNHHKEGVTLFSPGTHILKAQMFPNGQNIIQLVLCDVGIYFCFYENN